MNRNFCTTIGNITHRFGPRAAMSTAIKLLIAACLLFHPGCTPTAFHGKYTDVDKSPAILRDILITGAENNSKIEILLSKPLKYKLYSIAEPPREVIDLSPVALNPFKTPVDIKSSLVSRIDIITADTDGHPVTRIIFKLNRHVEFSASTDQLDNKKIVLTVIDAAKNPADQITPKKVTPSQTSMPSSTKATTTARKPRNTVAPRSHSKHSSALKTASSRPNPASPDARPVKSGNPGHDDTVMIIRSVDITRRGIFININGVGDNFRFFRLAGPQRLVIDVLGAKNTVEGKLVPVNRFGIRSVRLGTYPDKARIVFDASGKAFPVYKIEVDNLGIKVLF